MTAKFQFSNLPKDEKLAESFDVYLCNEFSLPSFAINLYRKNMKHMKLGMMTFMLCLIQKQV
ncbi:unnamed protein product [Larinioides sclopetarius]|uniref:Uncharacterized protein n=1 Tax=Larinioides sclopetarius TaxID=280406 RepID=A0AAV1ZV01_9ARAC